MRNYTKPNIANKKHFTIILHLICLFFFASSISVFAQPTILSSTLSADDSYIDVIFSESVWSNSNQIGGVNPTDFQIIFTNTGGTASAVSIISTAAVAGGNLGGGENSARLFLNISGTPNGTEKIEIKPATNLSIFNASGIPMKQIQTTGQKTLNLFTFTSALYAYFPFNGNAKDASVWGNHGSITGASLTLDRFGKPNSAYYFDGNDNINCGSNIDIANKPFSFSFWVKRNAVNRDDFILGHGNQQVVDKGMHIGFRSSNVFTMDFYGDGFNSSAVYTDYGWHQWTMSFDPATKLQSVYLDGNLIGTRTSTGNYSGSGNFLIGQHPWGGNFIGFIDDFRVYSRVLSSTNIQQLYEIEKVPSFYSYNLAPDNSYIDITFNEPIWGNSLNTLPVNNSAFVFSFNQNGGTLSNIQLSGIQKISGGALTGGENIVRLMLTLSGTPNGRETLNIGTTSNSIYKQGGNPMPLGSNTGHFYIDTSLVTALQVYYPFNGNAKDESGWSNDGLVTSASTTMDRFGIHSSAYYFDGVDDYVRRTNFPAVNRTNGQELTVSTWIKPDRLGGTYQEIVCNRNAATYQWMLYMHGTDGSLQVHGTAQNKSTVIPPLNKWTHVVVTIRKDGNYSMYINGQSAQSLSGFSYQTGVPNELSIGNFGNNSEPFKGFIDDVRVYSRALTSNEVKNIFDIEKNVYLLSFNLSPQKNYIDLTFTEGVWGNNSANQPLNASSFIYTFNSYGGTLTNLQIANATRPDGSVLTGGEKTVRLNFTLTGIPNGKETLLIQPANNNSIFNSSGKPLLTDNSTGVFGIDTTLFTGIVAYYPFNGNANDESGNGLNGTVSGVTLSRDRYGVNNKCYSFNGSNNYIALPNALCSAVAQKYQITIGYWFKGVTLQSAVRLQDANGYISASWSSPPVHIISTDGGTTTPLSCGNTINLYDGKWHHIVMVWKSNATNGYQSYLDGVLVAQRNSANVSLPNVLTGGYLGSGGGTGEFLNGQMDEVRIFNRALTPQEINQIYEDERPITIKSIELAADNSNIKLNLNKNVWGNSALNQPIALSNFVYTFNANGGTLTNLSLTGVFKADGSPLVGGESTIRINFNLMGTPNGKETLEIKPKNSFCIFADANKSMSSDETTGKFNLDTTFITNIVAYYPFTGNAVDESGNNSTTTIVGCSLTFDRFGKFGNAMEFNGVNQFIRVRNLNMPISNSSYTISAWVKPDKMGTLGIVGWGAYPNNNESLGLRLMGTNQISNFWMGSEMVSTVGDISGKWSQIICRYDGANRKIFLNNVLVATQASSNLSIPPSITSFNIGSAYTNDIFDGAIDEVKIYKRPLSDSEIAQNYLNEKPISIMSGALSYDNTYALLTVSDPVWRDETLTSPLDLSCFILTFNPNGGTMTGVNMTGIFKQDGSALIGGESIVRITLSMTGTCYGNEYFEIRPSANQKIFSYSGKAMLAYETTGKILIDTTYNTGMVANLNFEGNAADVSGNNNSGFVTGATSADGRTGNLNGAYYFDGNDYIAFKEPSSANTNIYKGSIVAWIKTPGSGAGHHGIAMKPAAYSLFLYDNKLCTYDWGLGQNRVTNQLITDNIWHLVGISFESGVTNKTFLYYDGICIYTTNITVANHNDGFVIGAGGNPGTSQFHLGSIDDVRIWDRPLYPNEFKDIFLKERPVTILTFNLTPDKKNVDITFSEGVYGNNSSTAPIGNSAFVYTFNSYGGAVTSITLGGVFKTDGSALIGGESTIRVKLNYSGTISGQETLGLSIASNSVVYNKYGSNATVKEGTKMFLLDTTRLSGMIAYYPFNSNAFDESGNGNDGNATGASLTSDRFGLPNSAYDFNGINNYINCGPNVNMTGTQPRTVTGWIYTRKFNNGAVFRMGDQIGCKEFSFKTNATNNQYRIGLNGCGEWDATTNGLNSWHQFCVTYTGSKVTFYWDGIKQSEVNATLNTITGDFLIGQWFTSKFFDGKIDDIRVYNRAITGDEIFDLYNYEKPVKVSAKSFAADNSYIDINFSEGVWGNSGANKALTTTCLLVAFNKNGGNITNILVTGLFRTDGSALIGGESTIRIGLNIIGVTNGKEALKISPTNNYAVYKYSGKPMDVLDNTGDVYIDTTLNSGLIAFYQFSGNVNDGTGNGYHGTASGGVALTNDRFGYSNKCYKFDGVDDYVQLNLPPTSTMSVGAWVKWGGLRTVWNAILSSHGGTGSFEFGSIYIDTDRKIKSVYPGITLTTPYYIKTNKWYYVVSTYDGKTARLYVDGKQVSEATSAGLITNNMPYAIGRQGLAGGANLQGYIDDVRLYTRAISADEVMQLYTMEHPISIESTCIAIDNSFVDLTLNEGVWGNSGATLPLSTTCFIVSFNQAGGSALGVSINDVRWLDNNPLTGGERNLRLGLTINGVLNGKEYIVIRAANNSNVFNAQGNPMSTDENTGMMYVDTTLLTRLIGYFPFNGNVLDESNNINSGILYGAQLTFDRFGQSNRAYSFDGVDDYVNTKIINKLQSWTIAGWWRANSFATGIGVLSSPIVAGIRKYNSYSTWYNDYGTGIGAESNSFKARHEIGNLSAPYVFYPNQWYLSTAVFNVPENRVDTYVNGKFVYSWNVTYTQSSIYDNFFIGRDVVANKTFDGKVDDIRFYDRPLTQKECAELYSVGAPPTIDTISIGTNKKYVDISFSENMYGDFGATIPVYPSCFIFTFNSYNGTISDISITGVTDRRNLPLTSGEDTIRVHIDYNGTAFGRETIQFGPVANQKIFSVKGYSIPVDETTGYLLFDTTLYTKMIAYYPFNGNTNDESGFYNNHAINVNGVPIHDRFGVLSANYDFNGNNSYIQSILNISEINNAVSMWFKTTNPNTGFYSVGVGVLGAGGNDRHIYLSNGNVFHRLYNNEIIGAVDKIYNDGKWHHVVVSYGIDYPQKLYIDGELKATGTKKQSDFTTQDRITIGYSNDPVYKYHIGQVDDVRIYDRTLSQNEVKEIYNLERNLSIRKAEPGTENSFLDITFSDGVWANSTSSQALTLSCFNVYLYKNGGSVRDIQMLGLFRTDGSNPIGGESVYRITLSQSGLISGKEQYEIKPANNSSIFGANGKGVSIDETSGKFYLDTTLLTGLIAYYPFNGNAKDQSGSNYHGLGAAGTITYDRFTTPNSCYRMRTSNIQCDFPNYYIPEFSASMWLRPWTNYVNPTARKTLLMFNGLFQVFYQDGKLYVEIWKKGHVVNTYSYDKNFSNLEWVFIGCSAAENREICLYVNKTKILLGNADYIFDNIGTKLYLGNSVGSNFLDALLDEVRIYNRVLSTYEMEMLYSEKPKPDTHLPTIINLNPISIDFGTTDIVDGEVLSLSVSVTNNGDSKLEIDSISALKDPFKTYFSAPATIFENNLSTIRVRFDRSFASKTYYDTLNIFTNGSLSSLEDSLKTYLSFSGTADNDCSAVTDVTVTSATLTTDLYGNINKAYNFDGTSSKIIYANLNQTSVFNGIEKSISFRIKPYNTPIYPNVSGIISKFQYGSVSVSEYYIGLTKINNQYKLMFSGNGTNSIASCNIKLNEWQTITILFTNAANNVEIFRNGKPVGTLKLNLNNSSFGQNLNIGNIQGLASSFFDGLIDDIRFYNRILTPIEIKSLYGHYQIPIKAKLKIAAPVSPTLFEPTDGYALGFTAHWSELPTAEKYVLELADCPNFENCNQFFEYDVTTTSIDIKNLTHNKTYYYRVKGYNEGGYGPFSEVDTIGTHIPIAKIQSSSIIALEINTTYLKIGWKKGDGEKRIVCIKESMPGITPQPELGTIYVPSNDWNDKKDQLGNSGYYVVYNGTGDSLTIRGLKAGVSYFVQIYEYSGFYPYLIYLQNPNTPVQFKTLIDGLVQPWWIAKSADSENVLTIDNNGTMMLATDNIKYGSFSGTFSNSVIIKNHLGNPVFVFNKDYALIRGAIIESCSDEILNNYSKNNLIIKSELGEVVARFDDIIGNIYIKGKLIKK